MSLRYEIRDSSNPRERGQRFSTEDRARRELTHAVGVVGRWVLPEGSARRVRAFLPAIELDPRSHEEIRP